MTRSTTVRRSAPLHRFTTVVQRGVDHFPFQVCMRGLRLGPKQPINYAWMDSTGFRITKSRRERDHTNVRNIIGNWMATQPSADLHQDPRQIRRMLMAASYAVLSGGKATHQVIRDSHLRAGLTRPKHVSLPDDVNLRIREVVRSRDRDRVGAEFDLILGVPETISDADWEVMKQTFVGIMDHGLGLVRENDTAGVWQFMGMVDSWAAAKRKRGNQGWLRTFLNRLAYGCKAAFYACYETAWVDIIPVLCRDHGLDPVGERFMRFWHAPNQPTVGADGTVITDVFRGQVLALHPLSGFFMQDPALLAVAGRFFGTEAHDRVFAHGDSNVPEYWELIGAILTAGYQYRQALESQETRRGARFSKSDEGAMATPGPTGDESSSNGILGEYAAARRLRCPRCQGELRFEGVDPVATGVKVCSAACVCKSCCKSASIPIPRDDFAAWCGEV